MNFLNATTDITFKKLFGTEEHKNILLSFLNNVLNRSKKDKIIDVTFLDPYNHPDTPENKLSIVDVRCSDQEGNQYIIEIQVVAQPDYIKRAHYYVARALGSQLQRGEDYKEIVPVIFIGIVDFTLFPNPLYSNDFFVTNKECPNITLDYIEFHFIELPKFTKTLEQLETIIDKWIYLLKNAETLKTIPEQLEMPKEVCDALEVLEQGTWSEKDLDLYFRAVDTERIVRSIQREAKFEEKIEVAKKMLARGLPIETICEFTGLNPDEVKIIQ